MIDSVQAANAHVGQVKEFHSPSTPTAPSVPSSADLASEIEAYEREVRYCILGARPLACLYHLFA